MSYDHSHTGTELAVLISDWHIGSKFELADNAYSLEIARKRLQSFLKDLARITGYIPGGGPDAIHILGLGDWIHNQTMRGSAKEEAEMDVIEQQHAAADLLVEFVHCCEFICPYVDVHFVHGNHGRIGRPGENTSKANFDRNIAMMVQRDLRQEEIEVTVADSRTQIVDVAGFPFAITHGDQIRAYQGFPYYGMTRLLNRLYAKHQGGIHAMCVGHWHKHVSGEEERRWVICNGSLVGEDPWSDWNGWTAGPSQTVVEVQVGRGITAIRPIPLDREDKGMLG